MIEEAKLILCQWSLRKPKTPWFSNGACRLCSGERNSCCWPAFGGMLGLMLFAGIDSLRALRQMQSRNVQIRQTFLLRNRALEEIRSALYQSGTFTRDYLLEQDAARAETYRASLQRVRGEMDAALDRYSRSLDNGEASAVSSPCRPASRTIGNCSIPSSIGTPRRSWPAATVSCTGNCSRGAPLRSEIADRIGAVNEQELNNGDERLKDHLRPVSLPAGLDARLSRWESACCWPSPPSATSCTWRGTPTCATAR